MPVSKQMVEVICSNCGMQSLQRKDHANRSDRNFCSRACSAENALKIKVARASAAIGAPDENVKKCSSCGEVKLLTEFHKGNYKYGRRPNCKKCRSKEDNTQGRHKWRDYRLKKAYGIGIDEYEEMYAEQNGRCAICDKPNACLVVDHDHKTGSVRQLLCGTCNAGIGMLQEDVNTLLSAAAYLEKHNASS